jgi:16S rRNA G527 N7-methylase RsmG
MAKAFTFILKTAHSQIPDIGCGTGVPTLWLAENLIFKKLSIIKQIHPVSDPFIISLKEIL